MPRLSMLIYGQSGTAKTSLLYSFMKWLRQREPTAIARLVSAENWATIQDAVDAGWVEPWNINDRAEPFSTMRLATMGYWPEDPEDPSSKLVASTPSTFTLGEGNVRAYFFEGMASIGDYLLGGYVHGALADRAARGEDMKAREDSAAFKDGEFAIGGNARTDYNVVQKEVHGLVVASHHLPVFLIWTAHQTDAIDDRGKPVIGPEIVGDAATKRVPRWFANILHTVATGKRNGSILEPEFKVYTRIHFDEAANLSAPYIAKNQVRSVTIDPFLQEGPKLHRDDIMGRFMDLVAEHCGIPEPAIAQTLTQQFAKWRPAPAEKKAAAPAAPQIKRQA